MKTFRKWLTAWPRILVILLPSLLLSDVCASDYGPSLYSDGNATTRQIETQSGTQLFMANAGFLQGGNQRKVFGSGLNKNTTLWGNKRRSDSYRHSIRVMAQQPVLAYVNDAQNTQAFVRNMRLGASETRDLLAALDSLNTNYVEGSTVLTRSGNKISQALRTINPKSFGGVRIQTTNLKHLGNALQDLAYVTTIADFVLGAAFQEALAGDLALGRLEVIEKTVRELQLNGRATDPVIMQGIALARKDLIRSKDYWGALMTEISDRKAELVQMGLVKGIHMVQVKAVPMLKSYYMAHASMTSAQATTAASTVAGLWAGSILATYKTIDALLEQHQKGQIAVTSATMAYLLEDSVSRGLLTTDRNMELLILQAKHHYLDLMVQVTSGFLPGFHDFMSPGQNYKDSRASYTQARDYTEKLLKGLAVGSGGSVQVAGQSIIAVVDSSGSMESTDPQNLRIRALGMMLDVLSEQTRLGIIDFDSSTRTILNPTLLGPHTSDKRRSGMLAVRRIDSNGGTDIPAALRRAAAMIKGAGLSDVAVVLLTDGDSSNWDGTAPMLPAGTVVHTLAFSEQANRQKLARVSAETGGVAEIARTANDLPDIISRLFEGAESREVLFLERGTIQAGDITWYDLVVDPGLLQLLIDVFWPGSDLDLELVSPSGQRYTTASARNKGMGVESDYYDLISIPRPEAGNWKVGVKGVQVDSGGESFTVRASTSGNPNPVSWRYSVPVPEVGASFSVAVDSGGRIRWRDAEIWLTDPDGNRIQLPFSGGGLGSVLSGSSATGILNFVPKQIGYHRLRIVLEGVTNHGDPVVRVLERAVNVAPPGKGQRWKHEIVPFIRRH